MVNAYQNAAFASIFIASLLGSTHCAGMCGCFVVLYSHNNKNKFISHALYNFGRLVTYLFLGFIAALAGKIIDTKILFGNSAALIVGIILVISGTIQLLGLKNILSNKIAGKASEAAQKLARPLLKLHTDIKPFIIGFVTTFLPCGWLYTFVSLSLAAADPFKGLIIMFTFWLGTLPVMLSVGFFIRLLGKGLGRILPRLSAVLVILAGIFSIYSSSGHAHHSHEGHGNSQHQH